MNIENFNKLISFLENLEVIKFDLRSVVKKFDKEQSCGTVCCAVGWFPVIFPDECSYIMIHEDENFDNHDVTAVSLGTDIDYESIASKMLGIPVSHASLLFTPWDEGIYRLEKLCSHLKLPLMPVCEEDATPSDMVTLLKSYMEFQSPNIMPEASK